MNYLRIHIYDCDGLMIDSTHRYKTVNNKIDLDFWRKNDTREMILKDSLMPMADHYKASLANPDIFVIIATARACTYNDANYEFIYKHLGKPNKFIHRMGVNDTRGGAVLKINGIRPLLALNKFKGADIHVYEDNHKYLHDICHALKKHHKVVGHFNPSNQGH